MKYEIKNPNSRKAEIIGKARVLFLTKDYDKTTMQDVMSACGIAKGTIYHYFKSKEELLEAVVIDIVDIRLAYMGNQLLKIDGNALEKIQKLFEISKLSEEHPQLLDHLHKSTNAAMHLRILAETLIKLTPIYEMLIKQGCQEGLFQTECPKECAEFILFAVQFLADTGIYPWSNDDLRRRINAFPKLIERQLKAPPGSLQFISKLMS